MTKIATLAVEVEENGALIVTLASPGGATVLRLAISSAFLFERDKGRGAPLDPAAADEVLRRVLPRLVAQLREPSA